MDKEREEKERDRLPIWEDPDIDLERGKANGERWKREGSGATKEEMVAEYNKAKKVFEV